MRDGVDNAMEILVEIAADEKEAPGPRAKPSAAC